MAELQYYKDMLGTEDYQVSAVLNSDQAAAIVKAHDVGIADLNSEEAELVDQAISIIKGSIRP